MPQFLVSECDNQFWPNGKNDRWIEAPDIKSVMETVGLTNDADRPGNDIVRFTRDSVDTPTRISSLVNEMLTRCQATFPEEEPC